MINITNQMTKEEKYQLLKNEILSQVDLTSSSLPSQLSNSSIYINHEKYSIKDVLKKMTRFLDNTNKKIKLTERFYCIYYDYSNRPLCEQCQINETSFRTFNEGYHRFCSPRCKSGSESVKEKIKNSNQQKYGANAPTQNEQVKRKREKTYEERYGVKNPQQNTKVREKVKQTNLEKYGVKVSTQNEKVKEKRNQTFLENYGVNNPAKSEKVRKKTEQTNLERYGTKTTLNNSEVKEKSDKSLKEKYGTINISNIQEIKDKKSDTFLKNFGAKHIFHTNYFRQKSQETSLKNYGTNHPAKSEEIKNKTKKTNLERYGCKAPSANLNVQNRMEKTNLQKYGVKCVSQNNQIKEKIKNSQLTIGQNQIIERTKEHFELLSENYNGVKGVHYLWKCKTCGTSFYYNVQDGKFPRCPKCQPYSQSIYETQIIDFLTSYRNNIEIKANNRSIIPPYELDIYLPEHNLAIEFNGLYWHSEVSGGKEKHYHLNKTKDCLKNNIELIHIFEDEWVKTSNIIKSMILNKIHSSTYKIYARKCRGQLINNSIAKDFLKKNHIQTNIQSPYSFGLFYKGQLVSVLTFGKPRYNKGYEYEIHRFCSVVGSNVIGGFSKLLKIAINKLNIQSLITYADLRFGNGNVYRVNGFDFQHYSEPNYYYFKLPTLERYSRVQFQKHKLKNKLKYFDPNLTEWQNMRANSYDRIWDCGNAVYTKII